MKVTVPNVLFALIFCEIQNLPGVFATAAEEEVFDAQPPSSTEMAPSSTEMEDPTEMPTSATAGPEVTAEVPTAQVAPMPASSAMASGSSCINPRCAGNCRSAGSGVYRPVGQSVSRQYCSSAAIASPPALGGDALPRSGSTGVEASGTQEHMAEIPGPADALAVLMQENMFQAEEHMAEIPGPADEPLPSQPPVPLEVGAADVDLQRATLASLGHDVDSMDEDFRAALLALVEDEEFVSAMDGSSSSTGASSGSASGSSSSSGGAAGHCSSQRF